MKTLKASPVELLAKDFRRWGVDAIKRVRSMTNKYGVCFYWYYEGSKG